MTAISITSDLMFSSRIKEGAKELGVDLLSARSFEKALEYTPQAEAIKLIIVDLESKSYSQAGLSKIRAAFPKAKITCFFAHVNEELANQASETGADVIYTRGQFVRVLPDILHSL